ncbi:hypothetical protein AS160_06660 [Marinitoga sp. 38H-ov]|nr:hypothetical protein AS160_06660 [Marinitoga sp. 38H-ov]
MRDINDIFKEISKKNNILKKVLLLNDLKNIVNNILEKYGLTSVEVVNIDIKTSTLFLYVENNYIKQEILFKKGSLLKDINKNLINDKIKYIKFTGGANK